MFPKCSQTLWGQKHSKNPSQKTMAMNSIIYQSNMRERYPITGCHGIVRQLQFQVFELSKELYNVHRQLVFHRQSCNDIPNNSLNLFDQNDNNNYNVNDTVNVNGGGDINLMWIQQVADAGGGFFYNNEIAMQFDLQKLTLQGENQQKVEEYQDGIHPFFGSVEDDARHSYFHTTDAYEYSCDSSLRDTTQSLEITLLRPD